MPRQRRRVVGRESAELQHLHLALRLLASKLDVAEHAGAAGSFFASIFVVATLSMQVADAWCSFVMMLMPALDIADGTVNGPPFQIQVVRIEMTLAFFFWSIQRLPAASVT